MLASCPKVFIQFSFQGSKLSGNLSEWFRSAVLHTFWRSFVVFIGLGIKSCSWTFSKEELRTSQVLVQVFRKQEQIYQWLPDPGHLLKTAIRPISSSVLLWSSYVNQAQNVNSSLGLTALENKSSQSPRKTSERPSESLLTSWSRPKTLFNVR